MTKVKKDLLKWFKDDLKDLKKDLKLQISRRNYEKCVDLGGRIDYVEYVIAEIVNGGSLNRMLDNV